MTAFSIFVKSFLIPAIGLGENVSSFLMWTIRENWSGLCHLTTVLFEIPNSFCQFQERHIMTISAKLMCILTTGLREGIKRFNYKYTIKTGQNPGWNVFDQLNLFQSFSEGHLNHVEF